MRIDVTTLYLLIVGTTLTGAGLMMWERHFNRTHRTELTFWGAGMLLVAIGCLVRVFVDGLPRFVSIGLSNSAVLVGYGMMTLATVRFSRGGMSRTTFAVWGLALGAWIGWVQYGAMETRIVVTALFIAAMSFQAVAALGSRDERTLFASRRLVRMLFAVHGLFFTARAVLTLLFPSQASSLHSLNFAATMIEGILWSTLAPPAFLIMARENTERRLTADSQTDFLTGIDNRRAFTAKAARLVQSPEPPSALVVFDLDHFKQINDRHGHGVGDDILRHFCRSVEALLAPDDVFGRLGGEEFAVVFRQCDAAEAQQRANLIARLYTAETAVQFDLSIRATVSGGIAISRAGVSLQRLLQEADAALYLAKAAGRDRTLLAENDTVASAVENAQVA